MSNDYFNINGRMSSDNSNKIWCFIDGDTIYQTDLTGAKKQIGVTDKSYNDLSATTQEYYNKLVELKVIIPPKSAEDVSRETQQAMLEMAQIMKSMQEEIKQLKGDKKDDKPRNNSTASVSVLPKA